jgi:hypothetical protein
MELKIKLSFIIESYPIPTPQQMVTSSFTCLGHHGGRDPNRIGLVCVALPKVETSSVTNHFPVGGTLEKKNFGDGFLTLAKFIGESNHRLCRQCDYANSACLCSPGQNDPILWPRQAYSLCRTAGGNFTNGTMAEWKYRLVTIL